MKDGRSTRGLDISLAACYATRGNNLGLKDSRMHKPDTSMKEADPTAREATERTRRRDIFRFILVILCLVLAAFLASLALGVLSAGGAIMAERGLTMDSGFSRYDLLSIGVWVLVPACLYLAFRLRPGGD